MSREALVLLVCCCDFRDGAERLIPSKSLRNAVIRAFPGLFRILRMCAPRRAAAVVRPRGREKSADRRRRILISRLLIIRASVPRRKSPFPAYFKGFPAVSLLIPPYPAFLKYPVSPQLALALVLSLSLAACASKTETAASTETASTETASETTESKGTITVAASPTPHAEILAQAKPILEAEGWTLEVKEFQDYVQPNNVVESGEFDANYFQHIPYLENFNEEQGTHLVNAGGIHYEPFGIYPGTKSSLDDIAEGDTIAVPNDTTNEARALLLLQDNGILKLKDGAGLTATVLDIEENPYNVEILELEAAQVPRVKDEVAFVVLNGNYALDAGFSVAKDALSYEKSDSDAAKTYVNVIAVKEGNENSEKIQALVAALKSDTIRQYINDTYDGAVVPFDD